MADTTTPAELDSNADEPELTEYTSESETPVVEARKPAASGPGAATGRRKQAIARVRIVPGSGQWTINGRTLDDYFPNKVHQQIVNEPFKVLELDTHACQVALVLVERSDRRQLFLPGQVFGDGRT